MFYCPHCNNIYNIKKYITTAQIGGYKKQESSSSSILSDTLSTQSGGELLVEDILENILNKKEVSYEDIKSVGISNILKHTDYKKLIKKKKEYVYNNIHDKLPMTEKKIFATLATEQTDKNTAYFFCTNCGFSQQIKPQTLLLSMGAKDDLNKNYNKDYVHHDFLPRTRGYVCKNKTCDSHKQPEKREAVMHRLKNSYKMRYVCTACNTSWEN
jgi:hypothetical protein